MSRLPSAVKTMRIRSPALSSNGSNKKTKTRSWLSIVMHTLLGFSFIVSLIVLGLEGEKYIDAQRASKLASSFIKQQADPKSQQKPPSPHVTTSPADTSKFDALIKQQDPKSQQKPTQPPITTTSAVTNIVKEVTTATITSTTMSNNDKELQDTFDLNLKKFLKDKEKPPVEGVTPPNVDLDYGPNIYKIVHATSPWKIGLRQDLRVNVPRYIDTGSLSELAARATRRAAATASSNLHNVSSIYPSRALLEARAVLDKHPLFSSAYTQLQQNTYKKTKNLLPTLPEVMEFMSQQPVCQRHPIMLSMATVGDDLYAALIETFVYSMVKFNVSDCTLVICVTDPKCMKLCDDQHFPCYDYKSKQQPLPSVMEQIGEVKLFHVAQAMAKGVDVFMLDLDVGFIGNPSHVIKLFYDTPKIDIFVEEDFIFIMNREMWLKEGVKVWQTDMLPNIGLFLCRGNEKLARVFRMAWEKYQKMDNVESKRNPGKDQNHVLEGMRVGRVNWGLRYAYFPNYSAPLLDKMVRFTTTNLELGGQAAAEVIEREGSFAVHTTCFEHVTKVQGLKAINAFWNPSYYDPYRPTITKPILYMDDGQVLDEIRSLVWLAQATGSAAIIPNLLGCETGTDLQRADAVPLYHGQALYPSFRVIKFKRNKQGQAMINVTVLEPAFYWRVQRDYDDAPPPTVVLFDPTTDTLETIRNKIITLTSSHSNKNNNHQHSAITRIVLQASKPHYPSAKYSIPIYLKQLKASWKQSSSSSSSSSSDKNENENEEDLITRAQQWATSSVGLYANFTTYGSELRRYGQLPSLKGIRNIPGVNDVLQNMRTCENRERGQTLSNGQWVSTMKVGLTANNRVFVPPRGNRTCFQVCE